MHTLEYQGSYVKVTLDVPGSEEFVANVPDEDFFRDPLQIGDCVLARWATAHVQLLDDGGPAGEVSAAGVRGVA